MHPRVVEEQVFCLLWLPNQATISGRNMAANVLIDASVLITFGLASPLLGLMIVLKQLTTAVVIKLLIGRYVQQAVDKSAALAVLEEAVRKFRGGDTRALLLFFLLFLIPIVLFRRKMR